jgi:NAD(P)-dependent dehydrogenase (short-subunit alcohol dehydrogenase family)
MSGSGSGGALTELDPRFARAAEAGPVVALTGGRSGIGLAIGRELLARNAAIWVASRDPDEVGAALACGAPPRGSVFPFRADLSSLEEIESWIDHLSSRIDRLDVLIHSAGICRLGSVLKASASEFERQFRVNVLAPYRLTQGLLPLLRAASGQVVFINSSAARNPRSGMAQYAATKAAVRALADSLRCEVNIENIRVISVFAGRTASPMQKEIHRLEGKPWRPEKLLQPGDVAAAVASALLLPRTAEVTDLYIRPMQKS